MKPNRIIVFIAIAAMALSLFCTPCNAQNTELESKENDEMVFSNPESQPEFPGGWNAVKEYLQLNIRYPKECVENRIEERHL